MDLDVPLVTLDGDGNVLSEEKLTDNAISLNLESSDDAADGSEGVDLVIGNVRIKTEPQSLEVRVTYDIGIGSNRERDATVTSEASELVIGESDEPSSPEVLTDERTKCF